MDDKWFIEAKLADMQRNIDTVKRLVSGSSDDQLDSFVDITPSFLAEMAEIDPSYNDRVNKKNRRFRVCVFENGEGPVPHVHIYYEHKGDTNHGRSKTVSYVCLHEAKYAPQHINETKILNSKERRDLIDFFSCGTGTYRKDSSGEMYEITNWESAVMTWIAHSRGSTKYFDAVNGRFIMPDYREL